MELHYFQNIGGTARQFIEQQFELCGIKDADDILETIRARENDAIIHEIAEAIDGPEFSQNAVSNIRTMLGLKTLKAA